MSLHLIHCRETQPSFEMPSMLKQGIAKDDILVFQDKEGIGPLKHFLQYMEQIQDLPEAAWHLQDDVIICKDFKERTEALDKGIVCGFCDSYDTDKAIAYNRELAIGETKPEFEWYSLQCIRVPSEIVKGFLYWYNNISVNDGELIRRYIQYNKHEDTLLRMYIRGYYPDYPVINLKPNLVDHIDYLLGGSVVNNQRGIKDVRSLFFEDTDLVQELEEKIRDSREETN